jgi:hypothetical protein
MTKTRTLWRAYQYQPPPAHLSAARLHNWTGPVSFTSALLAWVAMALHIGLLVASHEMTIGVMMTGCIVNGGLVNAALLSLVAGCLISITALVTGFAGVSGPMRASGIYRALAIAGLAIGLVALLACSLEVSHTVSPHPINPVYLHQC